MSIINGFGSSGGSSDNNYELMTLSQENISEQITTGTVYCKIAQNNASINGKSALKGYMVGKQDQEEWSVTVTGEAADGTAFPISLNTSPNGTAITNGICTYACYDQDEGYQPADFTSVLGRTASGTYYYIDFQTRGENRVCKWTFDFYNQCIPTFNINYKVTTRANGLQFLGSNDNSTWNIIKSFSTTSTSTITADTAISSVKYRYYQFKIIFGSSDSYVQIHNMYFTNVSDIKRKYRNKFTIDNSFEKTHCKNVIVPNYSNTKYITENTINGLSCDEILKANEYYKLRYNNGLLELNNNPDSYVVGNYTGNDTVAYASQTINLGFTPSAVAVYNSYYYCFATADGYAGQSSSASNAIRPAGTSYGYVEIVEGGFRGVLGNDKKNSFNSDGSKYLYIAFK